jgi:hypothetical protein
VTTGGSVEVAIPFTLGDTTIAAQTPGEPVPFSITVDLPEGVTADEARCEVAGETCEASVVDPSTVELTGEVPQEEITPQTAVNVTFTTTEPQAPRGELELNACTVIGPAGSSTPDTTLPAEACEGSASSIAFRVVPQAVGGVGTAEATSTETATTAPTETPTPRPTATTAPTMTPPVVGTPGAQVLPGTGDGTAAQQGSDPMLLAALIGLLLAVGTLLVMRVRQFRA